MIRALGLAAGALLFVACGGPKTQPGPCDQNPPAPECMMACDPTPGAANTCPAGYHCGPDGFCTAACTQGGSECGAGNACTADGTCVPVDGDANFGPDADCPRVDFTATRVTPTVQFLIDKSGSMDDNFGGGMTKYEAMKAALVGAGGIIPQYQAAVYFGATLYSQTTTCPDLLPNNMGTGRALNNLNPIRNLINNHSPGGGTPTGPSMDATYMDMVNNPPPPNSPPIIILATDGQPFTCPDNQDNPLGQMQSIAATQAAFTAGIPTFVLGVAVDAGTTAHLHQVANAGAGMDPVTGNAPYYPADNPAQLAAAFDTIIGGVVSCDLMINGDISPDQAAAGQVRLNGVLLNFGSDWMLIGTNIIRLTGTACATLQGTPNPTVTASFPCGAIIE